MIPVKLVHVKNIPKQVDRISSKYFAIGDHLKHIIVKCRLTFVVVVVVVVDDDFFRKQNISFGRPQS